MKGRKEGRNMGNKKEWECFNVEDVKREIRKLHIPKEYFRMDLDAINNHDISVFMSIRKDSGKTSSALIIGLVLNLLYGYEIEYLRVDDKQTTEANIDNIFDVIIKNDYIAKIYDGRYNGIEYKSRTKRFFLVKRDGEDIIDRSERPICLVHSLQRWSSMKSGYNNTHGNWFVLDEMFDTERSTTNQIIEFANQISTITRERPEARVIMLGNNLNKYSFWFDEFGVMDQIENLNYGGTIDHRTSMGTTIYMTLFDISEEKIKNVLKKKVRFFGFDTPKMAAFNGLQAFAGNQWQHIPNDELLDLKYLLYNRLFIFHRGRYVQICIYYNNNQEYVFLHWSNEPKHDDNIILTASPDAQNRQHIYGFGNLCQNANIKAKLSLIRSLREQNLWFYSSNSVGDLVLDYLKTVR